MLQLLLACMVLVGSAAGLRPLFGDQQVLNITIPSRPPHEETAKMARWLVHLNDWGTLATISVHHGGKPYGNTVSFSDGPLGQSTGRLLFYLTPMDATAQDVAANSCVTLSIAEAQLPGSCGPTDPEDPTCAKVSIGGQLKLVEAGELEAARSLLFLRHPQMKQWPVGHHFAVYELHIETIELLDYFGGAVSVGVTDYLATRLLPGVQDACQSYPLRPLCAVQKMIKHHWR